LDFFSDVQSGELSDTQTSLALISVAGYLGNLSVEDFPVMMDEREPVTPAMLEVGRNGWSAFRSPDPRRLQEIQKGDTSALCFLGDALFRHLEEFPSMKNGLSRSETQILEAVAQSPQSFTEIFKGVANREDRLFCGDATMAGYIERMSNTEAPLIAYPSGERIGAPRTEEDSRAFRNAEMALTETGRQVLGCDQDWIALGGSDRWLGGVHLARSAATWRWDSDAASVREIRLDNEE